MPATFEDFGFRFLYPDNWVLQSRESDPQCDTVTLDLPGGGFFSVSHYYNVTKTPEELLSEIAEAMRVEYYDIETDAIQISDEDDFFIESRFYYLDLLVISRITALEAGPDLIVVQSQAESREFDRNEPVFAAVIQSLRESL
jgi:TPP-dependent trihydroxycyclohexane-1,2-dione (THcHDO) dehydratase